MSGNDLELILAEREILMDELARRAEVDGGGMVMRGEPAYDIWYTDSSGHGWQLTLRRSPVYDAASE